MQIISEGVDASEYRFASFDGSPPKGKKYFYNSGELSVEYTDDKDIGLNEYLFEFCSNPKGKTPNSLNIFELSEVVYSNALPVFADDPIKRMTLYQTERDTVIELSEIINDDDSPVTLDLTITDLEYPDEPIEYKDPVTDVFSWVRSETSDFNNIRIIPESSEF